LPEPSASTPVGLRAETAIGDGFFGPFLAAGKGGALRRPFDDISGEKSEAAASSPPDDRGKWRRELELPIGNAIMMLDSPPSFQRTMTLLGKLWKENAVKHRDFKHKAKKFTIEAFDLPNGKWGCAGCAIFPEKGASVVIDFSPSCHRGKSGEEWFPTGRNCGEDLCHYRTSGSTPASCPKAASQSPQ
jgi:hypothetical protein